MRWCSLLVVWWDTTFTMVSSPYLHAAKLGPAHAAKAQTQSVRTQWKARAQQQDHVCMLAALQGSPSTASW